MINLGVIDPFAVIYTHKLIQFFCFSWKFKSGPNPIPCPSLLSTFTHLRN